MERIEDLIDLGEATVETKGATGGIGDEVGRRLQSGLSDD